MRPIVLEIGVCAGGSLWMWREYFPTSEITGIDIDPMCTQFEGEGVNVCIGDQTDSEFLREVGTKYGPFDVVIDDGGHAGFQVVTSLEAAVVPSAPGERSAPATERPGLQHG